MAYGITSESQLLRIDTVRNGCTKYIEALEYFVEAGKQVVEAGDICDKNALSVDSSSMQPVLYEIGQAIMAMADEYAAKANEAYTQAVNIYNSQVAELNEHYRKLAAEQAAKQNK